MLFFELQPNQIKAGGGQSICPYCGNDLKDFSNKDFRCSCMTWKIKTVLNYRIHQLNEIYLHRELMLWKEVEAEYGKEEGREIYELKKKIMKLEYFNKIKTIRLSLKGATPTVELRWTEEEE